LLVIAYLAGMRLVSRTRQAPLWQPRLTAATVTDIPRERPADLTPREIAGVWIGFGVLASVVGAAGIVVAQSGIAIAARTGLSETFVGGVFTAVVTSLPELVVSIAAVRRGALTLAVGGIIGGNSFDVLFLAFADVAYRRGSLYHAVTDRHVFVIALTLLLNAILLLGLLRREKSGIGNIGFESVLVLVVYVAGFALLAWQG
jgi:cation:H+ antiporter